MASVAVSAVGTWAYNVGIYVLVYDRARSAVWLAAVTAGRYIPALALSWLAGRLADRFPRRAIAVVADLTSAACMVALFAAAAAHWALWVLILVAAVSSTASRAQRAALLSLAADVVVESRLARTTLLISTSEAVAAAVGSALAAALLLEFSAGVTFILNGVSFVVSAILLSGVRSANNRRRRPEWTGSVAARKRAAKPAVWPLLATRAVAAYTFGADVVLLTVVASRDLGSGTGSYGWLLAASGAGGLVAAVMLRNRDARRRTAEVATAAMFLCALPLALFVFRLGLPGSLAVQLVRGAGSVVVVSTVMAALQRAVPSELSGRIFGSAQSLTLLGTCVGAVATPGLLGLVGLHATLVIDALAPGLLQIALAYYLRRFDRADAPALVALDPRVTLLHHLDLLRDATRAMLYELAEGVANMGASPGEVIVQEGGASDALYVLVAGKAQVTGQGPGGPKVLRDLSAPAYFGEIGLIRGVPRTATVTATSECALWRIPAQVFLTALSQAGVSGALAGTVRLRFAGAPPLAGAVVGDPGHLARPPGDKSAIRAGALRPCLSAADRLDRTQLTTTRHDRSKAQ